MTPLDKAKVLDKILLKFKDGRRISWDVLLDKESVKDLGIDKFKIMELVNILLANNYLQKYERNSDTKKEFSVSYTPSDDILITEKGYTVVNNIDSLGFEFIEKEKVRIEEREKAIHFFTKNGFKIGIASLIVAVISLLVALFKH